MTEAVPTAKDINGDGSISVADLVLLQSFVLGKDSDSLAGTIVTIEHFSYFIFVLIKCS